MTPLSEDTLHAYQFGATTKPLRAIMHLHESLMPFGEHFTIKKNKNMLLSRKKETAFILLMNKGCFSICYSTNDLYLQTLFSPTVVGLTDGYSLSYHTKEVPQHYLHAETDCEGWIVPLQVFVDKSEELNLWRDISRILAQRLMVMSAIGREQVGNDAYSRIKILLMELWMYPEEIRQQIKVASFIQRRTKLSRSRVMDILLALKTGNYISIDSGVLIHLEKLPAAF